MSTSIEIDAKHIKEFNRKMSHSKLNCMDSSVRSLNLLDSSITSGPHPSLGKLSASMNNSSRNLLSMSKRSIESNRLPVEHKHNNQKISFIETTHSNNSIKIIQKTRIPKASLNTSSEKTSTINVKPKTASTDKNNKIVNIRKVEQGLWSQTGFSTTYTKINQDMGECFGIEDRFSVSIVADGHGMDGH